MCFIVLSIHSAILYGHFFFLKREYSSMEKHRKEINFSFFFSDLFEETKSSHNS